MQVHGRISGRKGRFPAALSLLLALLGSMLSTAHAASIIELEIEGPIGVATADYVDAGLELSLIHISEPTRL